MQILTDEEIGKLSASCNGSSWCYDLVRKVEVLVGGRVAEACVKVCENLPRKFRSEFSNVSSECAEAIRNEAWREYL